MHLPQKHTSFPKQAQSDKIWNQCMGCDQQEKLERTWILVTLLGKEKECIPQTQNSVFLLNIALNSHCAENVCQLYLHWPVCNFTPCQGSEKTVLTQNRLWACAFRKPWGWSKIRCLFQSWTVAFAPRSHYKVCEQQHKHKFLLQDYSVLLSYEHSGRNIHEA